MSENRQPGPVEIMQMASGFWISQILFTGVSTGVFELLAHRSLPVTEMSQQLNLHPDALDRLLIALTALGLLEKSGQEYRNSPAARNYLLKESLTYLAGTFNHLNNDLYPLWRYLPSAVRENSPRWQQAFGQQADANPFVTMYSDPQRLKDFLESMDLLTAQSLLEVLENLDLTPYQRLLDVGGALGTLAIATVSRKPEMTAMIFDLPPVEPLAQQHIAKYGLQDRITFQAGDMFVDPLPVGADIISLSLILHDWDDERNRLLLEKCFATLPAGGTIMILEKLLNEEKTGPLWPAIMSLNMLVATPGGRERNLSEFSRLLTSVGFSQPTATYLNGNRDIILARKPA